MKIKYSFEQWCLDNDRHDILDLWDYKLNAVLPSEIGYSVSRPYYFKCPRGLHPSETRYINSITSNQKTVLCKQCRSLGQWMVDTYGADAIDKLWSDKNSVNPFYVVKNSSQEVWLKCVDHPEHPDYLKNTRVFVQGHMCPMCSGRGLIQGYNDVFTTHPWLIKYFLNPEQAKMFTAGSNKKVDIICPDCGHVTQKSVYDLTSQPFHCQRCGDGTSYPNKFVYEFLLQLQKKYNFAIYPEHTFEWSKNLFGNNVGRRTYDFYIKYQGVDMIIEVHGAQHFDGSFCNYQGGRTLEEEQQNDLYKKDLAIKNGIHESHYIVVDARKSDCDWISTSIAKSALSNIFDWNYADINWLKCSEVACKSLVKIASVLWNNGERSTAKIAKLIGKTKTTVIHYLKMADALGWCHYIIDGKNYDRQKPVMCTNNGVSFSSIGLCVSMSMEVFGKTISRKSMGRVLSTPGMYVRGLNFVYISKEDFLYKKMQAPQLTFGDI